MSHISNDIFVENAYESFFASKNGFERVAVLKDLMENGMTNDFECLRAAWYTERREFLFENSIESSETLFDAGGEFGFILNENGTTGDDHQIDEKKFYIPKYLNVDYWVAESSK